MILSAEFKENRRQGSGKLVNQRIADTQHCLQQSVDLRRFCERADKTGAQGQLSANPGGAWQVYVFPQQASVQALIEPIQILHPRRDVAKTTDRQGRFE